MKNRRIKFAFYSFLSLIFVIQLSGCQTSANSTAVQPAAPGVKSQSPVHSNLQALRDSLARAAEIKQFEGKLFMITEGHASYYADRFHGRLTANGERFDMHDLTAAHKTLPFGSMVRVTNLSNGKKVLVRINDRGPFIKGRIIDLSLKAAEEIGLLQKGVTNVRLEAFEANPSAS